MRQAMTYQWLKTLPLNLVKLNSSQQALRHICKQEKFCICLIARQIRVKGLVMINSVGVIDGDYYNNPGSDICSNAKYYGIRSGLGKR